MTRQQVVSLVGEPVTSTSNGALATMEYDFTQQTPGVLHATQPGHSTFTS